MTMRHTPDQLAAILHQWQSDMQQADNLINPIIQTLGLMPESSICASVWGLQSALTRSVAAQIGTTTDWLNWHAYENDFGRKGMKAGPTGSLRPIRGIPDLIWVMTCDD